MSLMVKWTLPKCHWPCVHTAEERSLLGHGCDPTHIYKDNHPHSSHTLNNEACQHITWMWQHPFYTKQTDIKLTLSYTIDTKKWYRCIRAAVVCSIPATSSCHQQTAPQLYHWAPSRASVDHCSLPACLDTRKPPSQDLQPGKKGIDAHINTFARSTVNSDNGPRYTNYLHQIYRF